MAAIRQGDRPHVEGGISDAGLAAVNNGVLWRDVLGFYDDDKHSVTFNVCVGGPRTYTPPQAHPPSLNSTASATSDSLTLDRPWPVAYFDGASRGNPGRAGCGAVLLSQAQNGVTLSKDNEHLLCQSNNVAEYCGLILALTLAHSRGVTRVEVRGDSSVVIKQMQGIWACRKPTLQRLQRVARAIANKFLPGNVRFRYIPRTQNSVADALATTAAKGRVFRRRTLFFPPAPQLTAEPLQTGSAHDVH